MLLSPITVPAGELLYPLPDKPGDGFLQAGADALRGLSLRAAAPWRARRLWEEATTVAREAGSASGLPDIERRTRLADLRARVRREGLDGQAARRMLAHVAAAAPGCGVGEVGAAELASAIALLRGQVAETDGEADEIAAVVLAAAVAGTAGTGTHVICPDADRVESTAVRLDALRAHFDFSLGVVEPGQTPHARQAAYRADVTCGPATELVNDTLRDALLLSDRPGDLRLRLERLREPELRSKRLLQRGLIYGIALGAQDLMLDRCLRTFALSGEPGAGDELKAIALAHDVAERLGEGVDFAPDETGAPRLTAAGRDRIRDMLAQRGGPWASAEWREKLIGLAILARDFLKSGLHYQAHPSGIELVDSSVAPIIPALYDRRVAVALLTLRHGLPLPGTGVPIMTMSQMEFLLRYRRLSGIDASMEPGAQREIWTLYRVPSASLRTGRSRREPAPQYHLGRDRSAAWESLADVLDGLRRKRRQSWVLAETGPTAESVAEMLADRGFVVSKPDSDTDIAGSRAPDVTVAVLGETPPPLPEGADGKARAHVVLMQIPSDASRAALARRWLGRCRPRPRVHLVMALDDPKLQGKWCRATVGLAVRMADRWPVVGRRLARTSAVLALRNDVRRARRARAEHSRVARRVQKLLAFSGSGLR